MRKVTTGQVILSKLKPSLRTQDCAQQCSKNMVILLSHIKKKHRKCHGPGFERGKTCGRGHRGQVQKHTKPRLEGGNTPF